MNNIIKSDEQDKDPIITHSAALPLFTDDWNDEFSDSTFNESKSIRPEYIYGKSMFFKPPERSEVHPTKLPSLAISESNENIVKTSPKYQKLIELESRKKDDTKKAVEGIVDATNLSGNNIELSTPNENHEHSVKSIINQTRNDTATLAQNSTSCAIPISNDICETLEKSSSNPEQLSNINRHFCNLGNSVPETFVIPNTRAILLPGQQFNKRRMSPCLPKTLEIPISVMGNNQKEIKDPEKFICLIRDLLHAFLCQLDQNNCQYIGCSLFKSIVYHITKCNREACMVENCKKIRLFLEHFTKCSKSQCNLCQNSIKIFDVMNNQNLNDSTWKESQIRDFSTAKGLSIFSNFYCSYLKAHTNSIIISPSASQPNAIKSDLSNEQLVINLLPSSSPTVHASRGACSPLTNICSSKPKKISELHVPDTGVIISEKSYDPVFIKNSFIEIIKKILEQTEAIFFNQPVDPIKLNIPDYFAIIREPMDLGTVMTKLKNLKYTTIWDVVYDINLVFDNAYLYNKKNTRVHKAAVKLSAIFEPFSALFMKKQQYCCSKRYVYSPQVLYCNSKDFCVIPCSAVYYRFDEKIHFCDNCYKNFQDEFIVCNRDGSSEQITIAKSSLVLTRNNATVYEPFVVCAICRKKYHKICVMHVDIIDGCYYYCQPCYATLNIERPPNEFVSRNLPHTKLSEFIENRVNNFLKSECKDCQHVNIRLICNVDKTIDTKPGLVKRFGQTFSSTFPYRSKAIFAFQELNPGDICFFSMHVQEFGNDCPEPNRKRVYLSYLDSVHYFQPRHLKTLVYHEIVLSYLAYCKSVGYLYCHIWSCPPCEGDDYVFHCHSFEQKLPKPRRLLEWYNKLIEIGIEKKIIIECKDIHEYFQSHSGELATSIPYFDGDYWSNSLEDIITEYEKDMNIQLDQQGKGKPDILGVKKKGNRNKVGKHKVVTSKRQIPEDTSLTQKIFSLMDKYREVFFVLKLNDDTVLFSNDTNPIFTSDLMDGRSGFLTMCRDNHWEFSSMLYIRPNQ
ncbi:LOW QUALITY PROTEIN: hypothetical protein MXB_1768 [Myxobolus squamalis]|nr:LOW QUALITY PROTEIN: hypothetical protein MXB_1768 [Myxobolus squamalis]